jgi:hypothetical protein
MKCFALNNLILALAVGLLTYAIYRAIPVRSTTRLTPWGSVGGCGSSAGSATGDVLVKWIGNGVSGALFDAELIMSEGALTDSSLVRGSEYDGRLRIKTTTALLSLYYHPPRIMDIKLSMPILMREGISTNTGGLGDLLVDLCRKWGASGDVQTGLSLIVPTGYADIMNTGIEPLASDNQLGGGLFSLSARGSYTFDFDWGIINLGGSYSGGFFAIRTTDYGYDTSTIRVYSLNQEFQYAREGWGARNDAGVFSPDYLSVFADFGIRSQGFTHGFSINYSYPLAQSNVEIRGVNETYFAAHLPTKAAAQAYVDTSASVYHGDTTNIVLNQNGDGSWNYLTKAPTPRATPPSVTLQYTVEKSDMMFPILVGGIVKLEYANRLNFAGISLAVGFKFPVY